MGIKISNLLEKPARVALICFCILLVGFVFDGSLWRMYKIHRDQLMLQTKINEEIEKIGKIKQQLSQLKRPEYIEKQALDRLEFLEKNDLLFVFSED
jgi:cell division protein FtsB